MRAQARRGCDWGGAGATEVGHGRSSGDGGRSGERRTVQRAAPASAVRERGVRKTGLGLVRRPGKRTKGWALASVGREEERGHQGWRNGCRRPSGAFNGGVHYHGRYRLGEGGVGGE
jgi:hypothetical protein